jgi:hypothetical protein
MKRVAALFFTAVVFLAHAGPASAQSEFSATLNGANERPTPVASAGFGSATFDVNVSGNVVGISYELNVSNVTDAFVAHIHCGTAEESGPLLVFLAGSPSSPPGAGYDLNGLWVKAKFTERAIIPGTSCGNTFGDLLTAMITGRTYVNVHTRANTGGEIRGQINLVAPLSVP